MTCASVTRRLAPTARGLPKQRSHKRQDATVEQRAQPDLAEFGRPIAALARAR